MPANADPGAITAGARVSRQTSPKPSASTPQEMKRSSSPLTVRRAPGGGVDATIMSGTSAAARSRRAALARGRAAVRGVRLPIGRRV